GVEAPLDQPPRVEREAAAVEEVLLDRGLVGRALLGDLGRRGRARGAGQAFGVLAHRSSSRSETTVSAPFSVRASCPTPRSTPITSPNRPACPAATPLSASSSTTARAGSACTCCAANKNVSGAGLPTRCRSSA